MKANFKAETETAKLPTRATDQAAGLDFYADESTIVYPHRSRSISTGISWNPEGILDLADDWRFCMVIQSRSGLAFKSDIEASNAGVIDSDYRGVINVKIYNHSTESFKVKAGDKICQGVPQLIPYFSDIENLSDADRGNKGFGSSGG